VQRRNPARFFVYFIIAEFNEVPFLLNNFRHAEVCYGIKIWENF